MNEWMDSYYDTCGRENKYLQCGWCLSQVWYKFPRAVAGRRRTGGVIGLYIVSSFLTSLSICLSAFKCVSACVYVYVTYVYVPVYVIHVCVPVYRSM